MWFVDVIAFCSVFSSFAFICKKHVARNMKVYIDKEGERQVISPFTTWHSHSHIAHTAHHTWGLDGIMYALKSILHKILNIDLTEGFISICQISSTS